MTHADLERALLAIIGGQRLRADWLESEADALQFRGDVESAERLRRGAANARAQADETVRGLARLVRARWGSPEYVAQTKELQAITAQDWANERAAATERRRAAEQRVAARRRAA